MQFPDLLFLLAFLPVALVLFYISRSEIKPYILLVSSLFFYALGQADAFWGACILTIINVIAIYAIKMIPYQYLKRVIVILAILVNASILIYFKIHGNWFPLGLSFYTFKSISVLCDTYTQRIEIDKPIDVVNYLTFWGQIQSGPITRYADFHSNSKLYSLDTIVCGLERFMIGLSKKVLIADFLVKVTDEIFSCDNPSIPYAWLGSICLSLQLYYDFSGYSDMAIGLSRMFGYNCAENFRYPYCAVNVSDFWRRWHISLGTWFRDYVYIPLGGSRVNKSRILFNLCIVWLLTGLWHGRTSGFVFWAFSYFIIICIEKSIHVKEMQKKNGAFCILYRVFSMFMVNILWVVFYYKELGKSISFISHMFIPSGNTLTVSRCIFLLKNYGFFMFIAIVFSCPIIPYLNKKSQEFDIQKSFNVIYKIAIITVFLISFSIMIAQKSSPFVYIGF